MELFKISKNEDKRIRRYIAEKFINEDLPLPAAYSFSAGGEKTSKFKEVKKLLKYSYDELTALVSKNLEDFFSSDDISYGYDEKLLKIKQILSINIGKRKAKKFFKVDKRSNAIPIKENLEKLYVQGYISRESYKNYKDYMHDCLEINNFLEDVECVEDDYGEYRREFNPQYSFNKSKTDESGVALTEYMKKAKTFLESKNIPEYKNCPSLEDLIGMTPEKQTLLMKPFISALYADPGEKVSTNPVILFDGEPGTGKSYTMLAIANEIDANIEILNASSYKDQYVGNTEKNFKRIIKRGIEKAKKTGKPSIIQIDEAEVMFPHKSSDAHSVDKSVMAMFNSYTDGPQKAEIEGNVYFVLTVNQKKAIDPSVISRASVVSYEKPSVDDLEKLLIHQTVGRYMKVDFENINWRRLAEMSHGLVQRDIKKMAENVKMLALERVAKKLGKKLHKAIPSETKEIREKYIITESDFSWAINKNKNLAANKSEPLTMFG